MASGGAGIANQLNSLFGSGALQGDTLSMYHFLANTPQFQQLLQQNSVTGSQFQNSLQGNLSARGLSTTGIGSIAGAAGQSAVATGEQALRGGLFGTAAQTSLQNLLARLSSFTQLRQQQMSQPSVGAGIFGSLLGAGGTALSGYLSRPQGK